MFAQSYPPPHKVRQPNSKIQTNHHVVQLYLIKLKRISERRGLHDPSQPDIHRYRFCFARSFFNRKSISSRQFGLVFVAFGFALFAQESRIPDP